MLLTRYHNIDFVLSLDLPQFVELLTKAYEKRDEEKMFKMWLTVYPTMTQENFMSFEDYKVALKRPIDTRSAAQIVEDTKKLHAKTEWVVS